MKEIWKPVKECNKYEISNKGVIRNALTKKLKYVEDNTAGYLRVVLDNKKYFVHRLVAEMFCEGYFEGAVVNHKDFDKHNNSANNLEWVSRSENAKHASIGGHQPGQFKPELRTIFYKGKVYKDISIKDFIRIVGICKTSFFNYLKSSKISYVSNDYPEKE